VHAAAERDMILAEQEVLTHYYLPLYEDYHLFALALTEKRAEAVLKDNLDTDTGGSMLADFEIGESSLEEILPLTESTEQTPWVQMLTQIDAYEKYSAPLTLLKKGSEINGSLPEVQEEAGKIEEEGETDQDNSAICTTYLRFLSAVEGIQTDDSGIAVSRMGKLKTAQTFAKAVCTGGISQAETGVDHPDVYQAMKNHYLDWDSIMEAVAAESQGETKGEASALLTSIEPTLEETKQKTQEALDCLDEMERNRNSIKDPTLQNTIRQAVQMRTALQRNLSCLEAALGLMRSGTGKPEETAEQLKMVFQSFTIRDLRFDYSGLQLSRRQKPVWEQMDAALKKGLLKLIFGQDEISKRRLGPGTSVKASFGIRKMAGLIGSLAREWKHPKENITDKILLSAYLTEHFGDYRTKAPKDGVLSYEREYILCGEKSDEDNLEKMTEKLVLTRTACNYLSLCRDPAKMEQAEGAALAVVGITGLPPLVTAVEHLMLLCWAFEESCIDVRALAAAGKRLPLLKSPDEFAVTNLAELADFSSAVVKTKADALPQGTAGILLAYEDYEAFFLFLHPVQELLGNTSALIGRNLQKRNDASFDMQDCYCGVSASMSYSPGTRFFCLPGTSEGQETLTQQYAY